MKLVKFIILGLSLFFCQFGYGDCDPGNISIVSLSPAVIDFRSTNQIITNIQVAHQPFTGILPCHFLADIDYGSAASFLNRGVLNISTGIDSIGFNTYSSFPINNNAIVRLAEEATLNTHVIYQNNPFNPSPFVQTQSRSFISELDTVPVNSAPGIYTESLVLKLRARLTNPPAGDYSSFPVVDTRSIQFIYEIPRVLDVSIVSTGQVFDSSSTARLMHFNKLFTGDSRSADIIIQTNVGYRLFVSSENNGSLVHTSTGSQIPYTMSLSGSNINLSGSNTTPVEASSDSNSSPATGYIIPMNVTIGALTGNEIGGRYRDAVSLVIQAF